MHIFLTGDIQVGKSTIIKKLISQLNLSADGFLTFWERGSNSNRNLYLSQYSEAPLTAGRSLLVRDGMSGFIKSDRISEIFDTEGVKAVNNSGKQDITVMDELGFLESDAVEFQNAVLQRIKSKVPVLGVIKPLRSEFLDAVREQPDVELYVVTQENREELYQSLLTRLGRV